jgi:tetratricopeptide (TPR) repeat protein
MCLRFGLKPSPGKTGVIILLLSLTGWSLALRAQSLPDLPQVRWENFEPGIREQLRKASSEAQAKPQNAALNGYLGMTLHTYEQYESAEASYQRAAHYASREFRWHYYLGLAQAALGKHTEAVAAFRNALKLQPNDLPARLRLAESLLAAGRFRESQPVFAGLAKQKATGAQAHYGLGQIRVALGDKAGACVHFRQAIALIPEYGMAHYALGLALRDPGQREAAQRHLALSQQYKYQRPTLADPLLAAIADLNASATDQLQRGVVLAGMGKLEPSIAAHERALEINPRLVQAHINLISLYARIGQSQKAEKHYQAAVDENPNLADSHFNYGIVLMGLERYAEAAEAFHRSLERNPFSADSHYNYAIIIERDGRTAEAESHFRQALASNPEHRQAHFHLARILVYQEKWLEAIEHFRQTLSVEDADTPRFMYALGATYARTGDRQNAIRYLREAQRRATALGQKELLVALERDLQTLEGKR